MKSDLLLLDGTAYVFETKATVPTLTIRRRCEIFDFATMLRPVTVQAYQAAQALTEGRAFYDREMRRPIRKVERAYPVGIGYEFLPLRFPFSSTSSKEAGIALQVLRS